MERKREAIAAYYAIGLTSIIREWLANEQWDISAEEILVGYQFL